MLVGGLLTLLLATAADHLEICGGHVTVFSGVFANAVFFGLGLGIFLSAV
jgi:hypothetical protein